MDSSGANLESTGVCRDFPGLSAWLLHWKADWKVSLCEGVHIFENVHGPVLRRAQGAGVECCYGAAEVDSGATFARILDIEQRSWKWKTRESIFQLDEHQRFYAALIERVASRQRLRRVFVRHGDRDIAYAVGGVLGNTFRGFQMGYDQEFACLGPGNIAQLELIRGLGEEGVLSYDLVMDVEYKERWADDRISL